MINVIIVLIVVVIAALALKPTLRHFKGDAVCCGGGDDELPAEKKELDGPVLGRYVVKIGGMHCEHCVNAVMRAINEVDGASARVSLRAKKAVVSYDRALDTELLKKKITDAGYTVESVAEG